MSYCPCWFQDAILHAGSGPTVTVTMYFVVISSSYPLTNPNCYIITSITMAKHWLILECLRSRDRCTIPSTAPINCKSVVPSGAWAPCPRDVTPKRVLDCQALFACSPVYCCAVFKLSCKESIVAGFLQFWQSLICRPCCVRIAVW